MSISAANSLPTRTGECGECGEGGEGGEGGERIIRANTVDLCVETFGDPGDPAILLIGGAASPMDWWDDELCQRAQRGCVGSRPTGRSPFYQRHR